MYRVHPDNGGSHDALMQGCHRTLAAQPGFLGRLVGRSHDDQDEYVEAIQWESGAHARAAFAAASNDPDVRKWLGCIDLPGVKMWGLETVGVVSRGERSIADPSAGTWLLVKWRTLDHVDSVVHSRNELLMHHEAFAPVPDYQGAIILKEAEGPERMELIAWSGLTAARARVAQILGSGHELVARHMADCAPGASLHYVSPLLRT